MTLYSLELYFPSRVASCRISKKYDLSWGIYALAEKWFEQSRHQTLFIPMKEKENIDKTLKRKKMVVRTKFRFGSRLHKWKVLTPFTSVLLNENLLVNLKLNISLCWLRSSIYWARTNKENIFRVFYLLCLTKFQNPAPTHLQVW